jgi:hypothetical protein
MNKLEEEIANVKNISGNTIVQVQSTQPES